jgi:hypothetical protein
MTTLTTLQIRDYAWMAQASYLKLHLLSPFVREELESRLQNDTFYEATLVVCS